MQQVRGEGGRGRQRRSQGQGRVGSLPSLLQEVGVLFFSFCLSFFREQLFSWLFCPARDRRTGLLVGGRAEHAAFCSLLPSAFSSQIHIHVAKIRMHVKLCLDSPAVTHRLSLAARLSYRVYVICMRDVSERSMLACLAVPCRGVPFLFTPGIRRTTLPSRSRRGSRTPRSGGWWSCRRARRGARGSTCSS